MGQERRRVPRYPFCAVAEVIDSSGVEICSQVTEISVRGCHLRTAANLPLAAEVKIKIRTPTDYFETTGTVVHSHGAEIAVQFHTMSRPCVSVLQKWVSAARSAAAAIALVD